MKKFICIHGHFYQPPRENAWLEIIERQFSAHPYHDWNERISTECYGPNGASRILNDEQKIINIVNNYESISFNFGPTLLSWMEQHDPEAYKAVLDADQLSQKKFNGHGNAIAQVYNHMIMPLANAKDRVTQVVWGIEDFKKRFNRFPEGMWLAETAVDTATLECLAAHNIQFTILAPRQAMAFRKLNDQNWIPVAEESELNTTRPYLYNLPSGKKITLFFYNGKISRDVAFSGLLNSGKVFADRLLDEFGNSNDAPQLVNIATDGESYGHHHYRGDMALASCIQHVESMHDVQFTNYAHYLSLYPPAYEIQIVENSSWSCVHGVERWRSNCGCTDGGHPSYHQKWREPLRIALNWLRDQLAVIFEKELMQFSNDPWEVRNKYISIILSRNELNAGNFLKQFFPAGLNADQKSKIVRLLEMQRHAMLMFTSCGWFFEEVSGIETKQILHYADRAIQIAEHETPTKLIDDFIQLLSAAPSNNAAYANAAILYEKEIRPQRITLTKVGLHNAVLSLFDIQVKKAGALNYSIKREFFERFEAGDHRFAVGRFHLTSEFTYATQEIQFAALYLGQQHVVGGYAEQMDSDTFEEMYLLGRDAFRAGNLNEVIDAMNSFFGEQKVSFKNLFREEQQLLLNTILNEDLATTIRNYRSAYEKNYAVLLEMRREKFAIPELLRKNLEVTLNAELVSVFTTDTPAMSKLDRLVNEINSWQLTLYHEELTFAASERIYKLTRFLKESPSSIEILEMVSKMMIRLGELKVRLKLLKAQNEYFVIGRQHLENDLFMQSMDAEAYQKWLTKFKAVGEQLNIRF